MQPRFIVKILAETKNPKRTACTVIDTQHERWHSPEYAISLRVNKPRAETIALCLNNEWEEFQANPW